MYAHSSVGCSPSKLSCLSAPGPFCLPIRVLTQHSTSHYCRWKLGSGIILSKQHITSGCGEEMLQLPLSNASFVLFLCNRTLTKFQLVSAFQLTVRLTLLHFPEGALRPRSFAPLLSLDWLSAFSSSSGWPLYYPETNFSSSPSIPGTESNQSVTEHGKITQFDATGVSTVQLS